MLYKTKMVQVSVTILYLCLLTYQVAHVVVQYSAIQIDGTTPISLFWLIQFSGVDTSIIMDLIKLIIFTILVAYPWLYIKNNHSFSNVQQRIGYKTYLKLSTIKVFRWGFILSLLSHIYELSLLSLLLKKLPSNQPLAADLIYFAFRDNTLGSWGLFTLLAALGWGIFAVLIFCVNLFINKNSIALVSGAIIGTLLIVAPAMLLFNDAAKFLLSVVILPSLIIPGQLAFTNIKGEPFNVYLLFVLASAFYLSCAYVLSAIWVKHKQRNG